MLPSQTPERKKKAQSGARISAAKENEAGEHSIEQSGAHSHWMPGSTASVPTALIQRAQSNPQALAPKDVLYLQRTVGNRHVSQLLGKGRSSARPTLQRTPTAPQISIMPSTPTATAQPTVQRVLNPSQQKSGKSIIQSGVNELYNIAATKRDDPAHGALIKLTDATDELAHAALQHPKSESEHLDSIKTLFASMKTFARLGRGGGYVAPDTYEKSTEGMDENLQTAGFIFNTFAHEGKNRDGQKMSGFKRVMSHVIGGVMNALGPLSLGVVHSTFGIARHHANRVIKSHGILTHQGNKDYSVPVDHFRAAANKLGALDAVAKEKKISKHLLDYGNDERNDVPTITENDNDDELDFCVDKNATMKGDILQKSPLISQQGSNNQGTIQRFSFGRKQGGAVARAHARVMRRLERFLMKRNAQGVAIEHPQDQSNINLAKTVRSGGTDVAIYKKLLGIKKGKNKAK